MTELMWIVVIASSIWVFIDAKQIGIRKGQMPGLFDADPVLWAAATFLLWIVVFPAYLVKRGEYKRINGRL